jgi:uncharacterized membrane protein
MQKTEYINQLKKELSDLPTNEVDDIIRDQEEFIREALAAGRSESEFLQSIGTPADLAKNIKAELKYEKAESKIESAEKDFHLSIKLKSVVAAVLALLVLAPFNLIFVLGPFLALLGILLGGWVFSFVFGAVSLAALVLFFATIIHSGGTVWAMLATFFGFLSGLAFSMVMIATMYFVSLLVLKIVTRYLRWNLNFLKVSAKNSVSLKG